MTTYLLIGLLSLALALGLWRLVRRPAPRTPPTRGGASGGTSNDTDSRRRPNAQ